MKPRYLLGHVITVSCFSDNIKTQIHNRFMASNISKEEQVEATLPFSSGVQPIYQGHFSQNQLYFSMIII